MVVELESVFVLSIVQLFFIPAEVRMIHYSFVGTELSDLIHRFFCYQFFLLPSFSTAGGENSFADIS